MRKTIATVGNLKAGTPFSQENLEQLADFDEVPVFENFNRDKLIGVARYPRCSKDRLSVDIQLNDGLDAKYLNFSVGFFIDSYLPDLDIEEVIKGGTPIYSNVTLMNIGTVSQDDFHD